MKEYMVYERKMFSAISSIILFTMLMACFVHGSPSSSSSTFSPSRTPGNPQGYERACYASGGYLAQDNCVTRQINVRNHGHVQSVVCQTVCKNLVTHEIISRQ
jgi:hypothetical protein